MSEIDTSELTRIKAEYEKARIAHDAILRRSCVREAELNEATRKILEAEFGEELRAAVAVMRQTGDAANAESARIRTLVSKAKLPYAEGTVLHEWASPKFSWSSPPKLTGRTGVIEIFKEGDDWPSNQRWGRPAIGSIIVRHLKKDGSKGKDGEKWEPYCASRWLPKKVEPKK